MTTYLSRRTSRLHASLIALSLSGVLCTGIAAQEKSSDALAAAPDQAGQISEYVRKIFQDRDGSFWFGTNGDGVCRYDGTTLTYLGVKEGLAGNAVRGIVQDNDGAMWFATDGGVSRYERGKIDNFTVADGLSDNQVWSMMLDRTGKIWVGTQGGVCRLEGKSFIPFPIPRAEVERPSSSISPKLVWSMFEDAEGSMWFGTDGEGVCRFDGKTFTSFTTKEGLAGNQVGCILGDHRGRIWFGAFSGGASCYDGGRFQTFTAKDGLSEGWVWTMLEDRAGNIWFSTLGAGVCRYDGRSFTAFRESSGLTRSHVQSIFEDKDGILWFGCSGGLFRYDGATFVNVTRNGPWRAPAEKPAPALPLGPANPMAGFARMIGGEWRVTARSGTSLFKVWHWGPGRHSLRVMTHGAGAGGQPWREVQVFYWHPGRKQIAVLGMSPFAEGVSEGSVTFEGDVARGEFDLYQIRVRRRMGMRWAFDGPDRYRDTLLENTRSGLTTLAEWETVRVQAPAAEDPRPAEESRGPSERLKALESLVGPTWETKRAALGEWEWTSAESLQATFEWIPHADVIYARLEDPKEVGERAHLLDAYFYRHTGTKSLRCLALSNKGGVYEGDVTAPEGGVLQLDLKGYEGDHTVQRIVRLDFEMDGTVRDRIWSLEGAQRTLMLDTRHTKIEAKKN